MDRVHSIFSPPFFSAPLSKYVVLLLYILIPSAIELALYNNTRFLVQIESFFLRLGRVQLDSNFFFFLMV